MENNTGKEQSPSAWAAYHRGQNASVIPAPRAAPTQPADSPQDTSGAMVATIFARLLTTSSLYLHFKLRR